MITAAESAAFTTTGAVGEAAPADAVGSAVCSPPPCDLPADGDAPSKGERARGIARYRLHAVAAARVRELARRYGYGCALVQNLTAAVLADVGERSLRAPFRRLDAQLARLFAGLPTWPVVAADDVSAGEVCPARTTPVSPNAPPATPKGVAAVANRDHAQTVMVT